VRGCGGCDRRGCPDGLGPALCERPAGERAALRAAKTGPSRRFPGVYWMRGHNPSPRTMRWWLMCPRRLKEDGLACPETTELAGRHLCARLCFGGLGPAVGRPALSAVPQRARRGLGRLQPMGRGHPCPLSWRASPVSRGSFVVAGTLASGRGTRAATTNRPSLLGCLLGRAGSRWLAVVGRRCPNICCVVLVALARGLFEERRWLLTNMPAKHGKHRAGSGFVAEDSLRCAHCLVRPRPCSHTRPFQRLCADAAHPLSCGPPKPILPCLFVLSILGVEEGWLHPSAAEEQQTWLSSVPPFSSLSWLLSAAYASPGRSLHWASVWSGPTRPTRTKAFARAETKESAHPESPCTKRMAAIRLLALGGWLAPLDTKTMAARTAERLRVLDNQTAASSRIGRACRPARLAQLRRRRWWNGGTEDSRTP